MPSLNIIGNVNLTGGKYNPTPFTAVGGIVNTFVSGGFNYKSHTFISGSGTFEILRGETSAEILVVGGGGGGESGKNTSIGEIGGNGGGAGGLNYTSSFFLKRNPNPGQPSIWNIVVGEGGSGSFLAPGPSALSGSISSFIATYGYEEIVPMIGYGGGLAPSGQGGSGGGSTGSAIYGDQGNDGGVDGSIYCGAGGGGAANSGSSSILFIGGDGGAGRGFTLRDGTLEYYAGGGGGGAYVDSPSTNGVGGIGGGGAGGGQTPNNNGVAGTANTGGGGGGGVNSQAQAGQRGTGGAGGSGIVIISYRV